MSSSQGGLGEVNSNDVIIVVFLIVFIVFTEIRNFLERRELINKLMSRDYEDYTKQNIRKAKVNKEQPQYMEV
jgi:hypothetical protein